MDFIPIKTAEDVDIFLKETNFCHDGYIISAEYGNDGITPFGENGHSFDFERTKVSVRILVTSLWDSVVELQFEGIIDWQIKGVQSEIFHTAVALDGFVTWTEDLCGDPEDYKRGSYVIAKSMKWRFVNDNRQN